MKYLKESTIIMLLIAACTKSEQIPQQNISSERDDNNYVKRPPVPWALPKSYVYHYTEPITATQGYVILQRPTCKTSTGAIDTMGRAIQSFNVVAYPRIRSFSNTYKTRAQAITLYIGWKRISSVDVSKGTGDPIPTGYQYSYTYYFDYTWPKANLMVTIYYNMSGGHISNAYVRTDTWGMGNYNSYEQITTPPAYINVNWETNSITFSAEGNLNIGFNISILGITGLNFTANLPVGYYGYITVDQNGGCYSGSCTAGAGIDTKKKAQSIGLSH